MAFETSNVQLGTPPSVSCAPTSALRSNTPIGKALLGSPVRALWRDDDGDVNMVLSPARKPTASPPASKKTTSLPLAAPPPVRPRCASPSDFMMADLDDIITTIEEMAVETDNIDNIEMLLATPPSTVPITDGDLWAAMLGEEVPLEELLATVGNGGAATAAAGPVDTEAPQPKRRRISPLLPCIRSIDTAFGCDEIDSEVPLPPLKRQKITGAFASSDRTRARHHFEADGLGDIAADEVPPAKKQHKAAPAPVNAPQQPAAPTGPITRSRARAAAEAALPQPSAKRAKTTAPTNNKRNNKRTAAAAGLPAAVVDGSSPVASRTRSKCR